MHQSLGPHRQKPLGKKRRLALVILFWECTLMLCQCGVYVFCIVLCSCCVLSWLVVSWFGVALFQSVVFQMPQRVVPNGCCWFSLVAADR